MNIPRIIHQIWWQGVENIPKKYDQKRKTWLKNHKDWTFMVWDEIKIMNLLLNVYPRFLKLFSKFIYIHQKIDFAKYIILHNIGGIYADLDTVSIKPIDTLLNIFDNATFIVSKISTNKFESLITSGKKQILNNGIIISKPNHYILKFLFDKVKSQTYKYNKFKHKIPKILLINNTTGPRMFSSILQFKNDDGIEFIDSKYLEPCLGVDKFCKVSDESYIDHQHTLTWMSGNVISVLRMWMYVKKYVILLLIVITLYCYGKYMWRKSC